MASTPPMARRPAYSSTRTPSPQPASSTRVGGRQRVQIPPDALELGDVGRVVVPGRIERTVVVPACRVLAAANHLGTGHRGSRFSTDVLPCTPRRCRVRRASPPVRQAPGESPTADSGFGAGRSAACIGHGHPVRPYAGVGSAPGRGDVSTGGGAAARLAVRLHDRRLSRNGGTFGLASARRSGLRTACSPAVVVIVSRAPAAVG